MRQLRLVGLAEDGASVVLATPGGDEYRLPVDERLKAACRGDLTRLGQIEIELESPLRPREIQSRVRAGESPEELAAASGMAVERVLRFAYPVLQERERVVAQARSTPLRAKDAAPLGELVEERLTSRGTDPATLRWDAWRREDGRWAVRLRWRHAAEHSALWTFELAGRVVRPDDPAAEQLSGEEFGHRTITAVTPLAAATAVASRRPPQPPRPGGGRPEPRASDDVPRADRPSRGAGRPAADIQSRTADLDRARPVGSARDAARPEPGEPAPARNVTTRPTEPAATRPTDQAATRTADQAATRTAEQAATGADERAESRSRADGGGARDEERRRRGDGTRSRADEIRARNAARAARAGAGPVRPEPTAAGPGPAPEDEGDAADGAAPARKVVGGEQMLETEEDRARRASVPSWDDILLGVRRKH